jgi:electron transfer flavoprotein beta subunit
MLMLNIIVCVKQVPDPEAPVSAYKVDTESMQVICRGVPPALSTFDEDALEVALQIKDIRESVITVISLGRTLAKAVLRKALAVGADELILLEDNDFGDLDSYATALILATAIKKIGAYDLVLTGMQAADTNAGVVGSGIAEILGIPSITMARKVELCDSKLRVERAVSEGYAIIESSFPDLITVGNTPDNLRAFDVRALVAAQKKPVTIWTAHDLNIEQPLTRRSKMLKLFIPQKESRCEFVEGETPEKAGVNLALKLINTGIIKKPDVFGEKK